MPSRLASLCAVAALALVPGARASGEPSIDPPAVAPGQAQLFSFVVEPEREGAVATEVELYPPPRFEVRSFAPAPGWHRDWTIQSGTELRQKAVWTREEMPKSDEAVEDASGEDIVFQLMATPRSAGTYTFEVRTTYADGSVIDWRGDTSVAFPATPDAAVRPAPTLAVGTPAKAKGGGGRSTAALATLLAAAVALAVAVLALVAARRR
jgi:hypothetical protein